ncbi:MAG TPA: adenylate/guanylate cyclase domain-containing protein [bacterium]|nr:adenylate/guanylate cyclase domain-containing protein [bacterium]
MSPEAPSPASPKKPARKHHLFSLRVKFILVLTVLICTVMGVVTWLVLDQMRQTLIQQVIDRGEAQARSLALNSLNPMLNILARATTNTGGMAGLEDIDVDLMQLVTDAMKVESTASKREIPTGLSPFQEQLMGYTNTLNEMARKAIWPDENVLKTNGDMEYAVIINKDGKVIAHNDISKVNQPASEILPPGLKPLDGLKENSTFTQACKTRDGREIYDIGAPVLTFTVDAAGQRVNLKVGEAHIGMNQNTITKAVRYVAMAIILTTVMILLIGILFMTIFVTILVKPIRLLVNGVSAIASGDFDQKINIKRADELGDLTDAFNDMAKSLREKEVIKGAFSKYVTKSVVDRILQHQDGLKLGGEKKTVTVFFSDIRGFTPMSEVLTAEQVVHILNEYFTAMTAIIFKYEGTLDKFMGDAIMAVYGAPIDFPDHAERAVLAALEMSEKMKELQAKWRSEGKREVNIGIGINTGEVVVGNIGSNERMEYTAIGDNVNLTQRLESVAEKGQILISSATYEKVKHKVDAVMLDPIKVKGKAEKVVAYSVIGLKS